MEIVQVIIIIYMIVMNLIGFFVMGADKLKSRKHRRRVPERVIFTISIISGSVGVFVGMYIFRHKTRHMKFVVGIPVIIAAQIIVGILLSYKLESLLPGM